MKFVVIAVVLGLLFPIAVLLWWVYAPVDTFGAIAAGLLFAVCGIQALAARDLVSALRKRKDRQ